MGESVNEKNRRESEKRIAEHCMIGGELEHNTRTAHKMIPSVA